jgi:hypothetical protein
MKRFLVLTVSCAVGLITMWFDWRGDEREEF